jgi:hypothetical protein
VAKILDCLAGKMEPSDLVQFAEEEGNPAPICEAYYYAAERCLLDDRRAEARRWLQKCVDTRLVLDPNSHTIDAMNEFHLARWRLDSEFGDRVDDAPSPSP